MTAHSLKAGAAVFVAITTSVRGPTLRRMRRALLVIAAAALLGAAIVPVATGGPAAAGSRPTVLVLGDSMAIGLVDYMKASAAGYDDDYRLIKKADGACNIGRGTLLTYTQQAIPSGACDDWKTRWPGYVNQYDPDVVQPGATVPSAQPAHQRGEGQQELLPEAARRDRSAACRRGEGRGGE